MPSLRTAVFRRALATFLTLAAVFSLGVPARALFSNGQAANIEIGQPTFNTDTPNNSSANGSSLFSPAAVFVVTRTVSNSSFTFVADMANNRVLVFKSSSPATGAIADYVIGQPDLFHSNANFAGAVTAYTLNQPFCVYSDGTNLYVCDSYNNRILLYPLVSVTTNTISAAVVIGQPDMVSSSANDGPGQLNRPRSVTVDQSGNLYIADMLNNRVLVFNGVPTTNGASASSVLGQTTMGACVGEGVYYSNCPNNANNTYNTADGQSEARASSVFIDTVNNVTYLADVGNNRVLVFNSSAPVNSQQATYVLGQPNFAANECNYGGSATSQTLCGPRSVWSNGQYLAVAEYYNNRVLLFHLPITANDQAATYVLGQANFSNTSCNGNANGMCQPVDAFYSATANQFFVADWAYHRVDVYSGFPSSNYPAATYVLGQAATNSFAGCNRSGANPTASTLCNPQSIRGDGLGNLYVGDTYNYRVLTYSLPITANGQAANYVIGPPDMVTRAQDDDGPSNTSIGSAGNIAVTSSTLIVGDQWASRVMGFTLPITANQPAASFVLGQPSFAGTGGNNGGLSASTLDGWWDWPGLGVWISTNAIVVGDSINNRLLYYYPPFTTGMNATAVWGQPGFNYNDADDRNVTNGVLWHPVGVTASGSQLFVADNLNARVLVYNLPVPSLAAIQTNREPYAAAWVLGQSSFTYPIGQLPPGSRALNWNGVNSQTMADPEGIWATPPPAPFALYVSDNRNSRELVWTSAINTMDQAANYEMGQASMSGDTCNSGGVGATTLCWAHGQPWADGNSVFIPDGGRRAGQANNNRVLQYEPLPTSNQPAATNVLGQSAMNTNTSTPGASPYGISLTGNQGGRRGQNMATDGVRFALGDADNNRVLVWQETPTSNAQGADIELGQPNMSANTANWNGVTSQSMDSPGSVFWDGNQFFVADQFNCRILVYNGWPTQNDQTPNYVIGQANFTSAGCNTTQWGLSRPKSMYSDGHTLFVADHRNNRVMLFNTPITANQPEARLVLGQPNFTSAGANWNGVTAQSMWVPDGVWFDGQLLYVADNRNQRVLVWQGMPTSNDQAATYVLGQPNFSTTGCTSESATGMCWQFGVTSDGIRTYASDWQWHRVLVWNSPITSNQQAASSMLGSSGSLNGGNGCGPNSTSFCWPQGMTLQGNTLWLMDSWGNQAMNFVSQENYLFYVQITSGLLQGQQVQQTGYSEAFKLVVAAPDAGYPIIWNGLTAYNDGPLPDSSVQVQLYKDTVGDGVFRPGSDTLVGPAAGFANGEAQTNFSQTLNTNYATYFLGVEINPANLPFGPSGIPTDDIRLYYNFNSFEFSSTQVEMSTPVPVGLAYHSGVFQPVDYPDFAQFSATSTIVGGTSLLSNTTGIIMASLQVATTNDWAFMTSLVVNQEGTAAGTDVKLSLYMDVNGTGQWGPGDYDLMGSSLSFGGGQAYLSPSNPLAISTVPTNLLIVADGQGTASNKTFGIEIDTSSFQLYTPDGMNQYSTTPFVSPLITFRPAIGYATSTIATSTWWNGPLTFGLTTGQESVSFFRAVLDQSPTHTWTGTEAKWTNIVSTFTPPFTAQNWYAHFAAYNAGGVQGNTVDLGPYWWDGTAPTGSGYQHISSTGGWIGEGTWDSLTSGATAQLTLQDFGSGLTSSGTGNGTTTVFPSSAVAYYTFDLGQGTTVYDWSGSTNELGFVGGATWGSGWEGFGLSVNGSNYAETSGEPTNLPLGNNPRSCAAWVYPTSYGTYSFYVAYGSSANKQAFFCGLTGSGNPPAGRLYAGFDNDDGLSQAQAPLNQWSHIATTWDGTWLRFYLNGVLVSSTTLTIGSGLGTPNTALGNISLSVGGNGPNPTWDFTGNIDDVGLWSRRLTGAEISALAREPEVSVEYSTSAGATWNLYTSTQTNVNGYLVATSTYGSNQPATLSLRNMSLIQSTQPVICNQNPSCTATDQVRFTAVDVAGNIVTYGPYAILVDSTTPLAINTPSIPGNAQYTDFQPNFTWSTPAANLINNMGPNPYYVLEISSNDPTFGGGNLITATGVSVAATPYSALGTYISTYTLTDGVTYYWRVQTANALLGTQSPWSAVSSVVTDFTPPSASNYERVSSTGALFGEGQWDPLISGVTVQLSVQDTNSGVHFPSAKLGTLQAQYLFDEDEGVTSLDFSGNNNTASLSTSGLWTAAGFEGAGLAFSGGQSVTVNTISTSWSGLTIMGWVKPTVANSNFQTTYDSNQFRFDYQSNATQAGWFLGTTNGGGCAPSTPVQYALNAWHHVALVMNPGAGQNQIYVDGLLAASCSGAGAADNTAFQLGYNGLSGIGSNDPMTGYIDDVSIYSAALSQSQIQSAMTGGGVSFMAFVSTTAGSNWSVVSSTLAASNVYVGLSPGPEGSTAPQTLSAFALPLAYSTNTVTCGGASPCSATDQVKFVFADRAGNITTFGPEAILVDTLVGNAVPTLVSPPNNGYTGHPAPTFSWLSPGATTYPGLSAYYIEVSSFSNFSQDTIFISTPTEPFAASSGYVSTTTLSAGTTYYWHVRVQSFGGVLGPWSPTFTFETDFVPPAASNYVSLNSTGGAVAEYQFNDLESGVTAQIAVQDVLTGVNLAGPPDAATMVFYQFEENVGRETLDSGSDGRAAYFVGGSSWTQGLFGHGLGLDGSSGYVYVDTATAPTLNNYSGPFTAQLWINPSAPLSGNKTFLHKGNGNFAWIITYQSGQLIFAAENGTGISCGTNAVCAATSIAANQWNFVTATYDGTTLSLYLNGTLLGSVIDTGGYGINADPMIIGSYQGTSQFFGGVVDDVRLYSYVRSPAQIAADAAGATSPVAMFSNNAGFNWQVSGATYPVTPGTPWIGVTGATGSSQPQTYQLYNINLVQSTSTLTGAGATNQVKFLMTDVAGNQMIAGPYGILFDSASLAAVSTPTFPSNGAYVNVNTPTFYWLTADLATVVQYQLEVSVDPAFGSTVINVTTPAVYGLPISTYTAVTDLANDTTYYWRVQAHTNLNRDGPWSEVFSFVTDFTAPSTSAFVSLSREGASLPEGTADDLATGVTAQITVQDLISGLGGEPPAAVSSDAATTALWRFDEDDPGSGITVYDSGPNGYNGTLYYGATWAPGRALSGLSFPGTNSEVAVSSVPTGTAWTIEAWSRFPLNTATNGWRTLVEGGNGTNFHVLVDVNGNLGSWVNAFYSSGYNVSALKGWHQIAAVGLAGSTSFYIDGAYVGAASTQAVASIDWIGNTYSGGENWGGTIDDLRIENVPEAAPQVLQDFIASVPSYQVEYSSTAGAAWTVSASTWPMSGGPYVGVAGTAGTTSPETLSAYGLNLAQSTNTVVCKGSSPCAATNQVMFQAADRAGNVRSAGPFAVLVDTTAGVAISTPVYPTGGLYVTTTSPTFLWNAPSTATISGLVQFELQASLNSSFSSLAIAITTANTGGSALAYVSTYTLVQGSTYYWRVLAQDELGTWSPVSAVATFVIDTSSPTGSSFDSINAEAETVPENLPSDMTSGATVQLSVQDAQSGLNVGSFAVMYSTDNAQTWVDISSVGVAESGTGETDMTAAALFGNRMFFGTAPDAKVYSSVDGAPGDWSPMTSFSGQTAVTAMATFGNDFYAGTKGSAQIWNTANGTVWNQVFTAPSAPAGSAVSALAVFNGALYAGVSNGATVYATLNGTAWSQAANLAPDTNVIAMLAFNGRLYAATSPNGRVWGTYDGQHWSLLASSIGGTGLQSLASFNGLLYGGGLNGDVYQSPDGINWTQVYSDGAGAAISGLAALNGKLYAVTSGTGQVYTSPNGTSWYPVASVPQTEIESLLSYQDALWAGTNSNADIYQLVNTPATLTGTQGTTSAQTLAGVTSLTQSLNTQTCGGVAPCSATNQILFTAANTAGLSNTSGPWAVIVDTVAAHATPLPGVTSPYAASSLRPEYTWGLASNVNPLAVSGYEFDLASTTDFVTGLLGSSVTANRYGSFVFNLTDGTTYYWRVRSFSVAGASSAFSATQLIIIDTDTPLGSNFATMDSNGNSVAENTQLNLDAGVTAQLTIQEGTAGIEANGPAPMGFSTSTVLLWRMDEGSGGVADDSSLLGNNGVWIGSPVWVNGRHGKAVRMDGSGNTYAFLNDAPSLDPAVVTVEAWVNTPTAGWIVSKGSAAQAYALKIESDGSASAYFGSTEVNCPVSTVLVGDGRWHMLAGVYNGTTGAIYVDGSPCASAAVASAGSPVSLRVGQRGDGAGPFLMGDVDEVRVNAEARTAAEIASDYSTGAPFRIIVTTDAGNSWTFVNSMTAGAAPYIIYPGVEYAEIPENLQLQQLSLAASTTGVVCGGVSPCGATNQIRFVYSDRAGNVKSAGPYAILVDTAMSQPTAVTPPNGAFVSSAAPVFSWSEPILVAQHEIQVSTNDFATVNVDSVTSGLTLLSPWALTTDTTYYWRVRGVDAIGLTSPWSPINGFVIDLTGPSGGGFVTITSTGGLSGETQFNDLVSGVTAELTLDDGVSGLPVPTAGLTTDAATAGLWHFDEDSGGTAYDSSGHGNNGNLTGLAGWVTGRIAYAVDFAGSQSVSVPYAGSLNTPSAMTIEAWINTTATNAAADGQAVATRWNGSSGFEFMASRSGTGGTLAFYAGVGSSWLGGSHNVADGNWHHVAATFDGTTARLYVDGALDAIGPLTNGLGNTSTALTIGQAPNDLQSAGFNGVIDEVRLSNIARSGSQIYSDYVTGAPYVVQLSTNGGASFETIIATAPAAPGAPFISVTGSPGATSPQTLQAFNLSLALSGSPTVCGGVTPCTATNQIYWTYADQAGNVQKIGPFAILTDTQLSQPVAGSPANNVFISTTNPILSWSEDHSMPTHNVEVSTDPAYGTLTWSTTTSGHYAAPPALTAETTYYWRVQAKDVTGLLTDWSLSDQFYIDPTPPDFSTVSVLNSTGGVVAEAQFTTLAYPVTAYLSVQDQPAGLGGVGLAVSESTLPFAGDGHDAPGATSGYGLMYSTNAGVTWVDYSSMSATLSGTGESIITALAVYQGRLYAATAGSARVYSSPDGVNWTLSLSGTGEQYIESLAVFNGVLYAGTYPDAEILAYNGSGWSTALSGTGETDIRSLAVFDNKLYAGTAPSGKVLSSGDGVTWTTSLSGTGQSTIDSMAVFNGRLYAGTESGAEIYTTADGFHWTNVYSSIGDTAIKSLAVWNGAIYAGTSPGARVYASLDGVNWSQAFQAPNSQALWAMTSFNGKLYAAAGSGAGGAQLFTTPDGVHWMKTMSFAGQTDLYSLAAFKGDLFSGTNPNADVLQEAPLPATLTGADATGSSQTLTTTNLSFAQSLSTATCAGAWGCSATNQLVFSASDLAGNAAELGPYAVIVDSGAPQPQFLDLIPLSTSTIQVDLVPVTADLAGVKDYQFFISSSPSFAAPVTTTPYVATSSYVFTGLEEVTTYYVRAAVEDNLLNVSPYSVTEATSTTGVMFFSTQNIATPTVLQGLLAPMTEFTLYTAAGNPPAIFNALTVNRVGGLDSDVTEVQVWADSIGNGVFSSTQDVLLGQAPFVSGQAVVSLGANARNVSSTPQNFFIVYEISQTGVIGDAVSAQLANYQAVGFGNAYRVPGTFPMTSGSSVIEDGPNDLFITPLSQAPTFAAPGSSNVSMLRLRMQTNYGTSHMASVVLNLTGTAASNEITAVKIYEDAFSAGVYETGDYLVTSGNDVFTNGVSTLDFTAPASSVTVGPTIQDYFVVFNLAASANSGDTFGVELATGTEVTLTGPDTAYLTVTPATSTLTQVVQPNTLTVSPISMTPNPVSQGQEYAVLKATMTVNQAFALLNGVTVNRTGTSTDGDVSAVSIWQDQAPPSLGGYFNPGVDLMLGSATFSGGKASITFNPTTLTAGTTYDYFVVYNINPFANPGDTIGGSLTNSAYISVASTATTVAGTFPFQSSTATITQTVNTLLIPTAQDVTTGGLLQGATNVAVLMLTLKTNQNAVTWNTLTVDRIGSGTDADIQNVKVYEDVDNTFTLDVGTDPLVSSGNDKFTSGVAAITFPQAQTVTTSSVTYFVAVTVNPLANPGDTFGIQLATTTAFTLNSPNVTSTATAAFPINAGPVPIEQYPNTIAVSSTSIAPLQAAPGAQNVGMLKLVMNTNVSTARWTGLKLDRVGGSDADFSSVMVYYDINQIGSWNANNANQYLLISSATSFGAQGTAGTVNVSFSTTAVLTPTPETFYVVVSLSTGATPTDVFSTRILNNNYYTVNAPNAVETTFAQSGNTMVSTPPSLMVVESASSAPVTAMQSQTNVVMMRLSVWMEQYQSQWTGLTVGRTGTSLDTDIERVKLYYDSENTGTLNPLLDTLLATGTFSSGQAQLNFNQVANVTTSTGTYYLVYDISPTATPNATAGVSFNGPGSFDVESPNGVADVGFPSISTLTVIQPTISGVYATWQDKAPAGLEQGATAQLMATLTMNTTQYSVLWQTLSLTREGTAADTDISAIHVYQDVNGNGIIEPNDPEITSGGDRFVSGVANITLGTPQQIGTSAQTYLIGVDAYMFAATTVTVGVEIASAAAIGVPSPNFVVNSGFPLKTSLSPVTKRPDGLQLTWTNLVPTGINQGVQMPMAMISASAIRDHVYWTNLNLVKQGTLPDGFVTAYLYLDGDGKGVLDASCVQVGQGTVASGVAGISLTSPQLVTTSSQTFLVTFAFSALSPVGDTVGFSFPNVSYGVVQSPDYVAGSTFTTSVATILDAHTPTQPVVTLPGPFWDSFDTMQFVWTSTVAIGNITQVWWSIGSTPGGQDVVPWTALNPIVNSYMAEGLALQSGTTYYVSVKAESNSGYLSPVGTSQPILVDLTVPTVPTINASVGAVSVLVDWTTVISGPSGLMGYLVEYETGQQPIWFNAKTNAQDTDTDSTSAQSVSRPAFTPTTPLTAADVVTGLSESIKPPSSTIYVRVSGVSGSGVVGPSSDPLRVLFGTLPPGGISEVSAYPNPFDSRTGVVTINYTLSANSDVSIKIYSIYGTLIKTLQFAGGQNGGLEGANDVTWDGTDSSGVKTSKGVYLALLQGGGAKVTYKIAVIH